MKLTVGSQDQTDGTIEYVDGKFVAYGGRSTEFLIRLAAMLQEDDKLTPEEVLTEGIPGYYRGSSKWWRLEA